MAEHRPGLTLREKEFSGFKPGVQDTVVIQEPEIIGFSGNLGPCR